jgi:hypothetical protein
MRPVSGWSVATGLLGVIVGVVGKYFADVRTGRTARLLEEKLRHAINFMEAADRLRRAEQSRLTASISLDNSKQGGDETYQHFRKQYEERVEEVVAAFADAEGAYNAIRLLIPTAASAARVYLDLCGDADPHPDKGKAARERARQTAEEAIRAAVGA